MFVVEDPGFEAGCHQPAFLPLRRPPSIPASSAAHGALLLLAKPSLKGLYSVIDPPGDFGPGRPLATQMPRIERSRRHIQFFCGLMLGMRPVNPTYRYREDVDNVHH